MELQLQYDAGKAKFYRNVKRSTHGGEFEIVERSQANLRTGKGTSPVKMSHATSRSNFAFHPSTYSRSGMKKPISAHNNLSSDLGLQSSMLMGRESHVTNQVTVNNPIIINNINFVSQPTTTAKKTS